MSSVLEDRSGYARS